MAQTVDLTGTITIKPATGTDARGSNGCQFGLSIRSDSKSAALESSSGTGNVVSPGSFVTLPVDPNMRGKLFFLRMLTDSAMDVRLTHLATGVVVYPKVKGLFVLEVDPTEAITVVEVQGTADFEWSLTGAKA